MDNRPDSFELPDLKKTIRQALADNKDRHPGIITEAIIDSITARFELFPRLIVDQERRRDHQERLRRLSHAVFRVLEADDAETVTDRIADLVWDSFHLSPRVEKYPPFHGRRP